MQCLGTKPVHGWHTVLVLGLAQQASSHFQNILEGRALCCNPAHLNRKQLSSGRCMEDSRHNGVIAMFLVNRTF